MNRKTVITSLALLASVGLHANTAAATTVTLSDLTNKLGAATSLSSGDLQLT